VDDIEALRAGIRDRHGTMETRTRDLLARIEAFSVMTSESAVDRERTTIMLIAVLSAAGLVLCAVLGVALKRSIVRPLSAVGAMLEQLADGHTDVAVEGLDRRGELAALTDAVETFRREIIRRRHMETALRQSEERYRFAVDESPAAILIHDRGQVVYANTAAMDLFGAKRLQQLLGRSVLDLIDPAFRQIIAGRMRRVQRGAGRLPLREAAVLRLDGSSVPIEATGAKTVFDGPPCVQSVFLDITRRKQAETALYRNERTLRRLREITSATQIPIDDKVVRILDLGLETLDLAIAIVSRIEGDTYTVEYARGPEDGPKPGMIFPLGQTYCADTLAADGPLAFHAASESGWRGHPCYEHFGLESYIGAPLVVDGRRYGTLNFSSQSPRAFAFSESEISLIQLLAQWIAGEKSRAAAVEALGISEERLKLALEGSNDGLWDWNVVTGEMYFSPRWQTMLGFRPGEVKGHARTRERLIHPDDKPAVMKVLREHLKGRTPTYETEHRVRTQSGDWLWILDRGKVVERDGAGRPLRTVGTITDIGERKRVERIKTEFVSTVSHELRTPLTSIHGSLGLVLGGAVGDVPAPAGDLLRIAESNSERLIGLVNDILDIEKIESGRMEFRMEVVDLNALAEQVVTANRGYADRLGVTVNVVTGADPAEVLGDPIRLAQVVTNLLSNAAKFSPEGETVEVAVRQRNGALRVEVTDRGPGIPEGFRDRVFDRFTQADSSDTRRVGGTGLGLSICRAIIDAHGGTIGFDSDPGTQTRFHFELPQRGRVDHRGRGPVVTASLNSVLYVEDEPDIRTVARISLESVGGFDVRICGSGEEAVRLAAEAPPDIVLLDVMMPGMDGPGTLDAIRSLPGLAEIPIVFLTAKVSPPDVERLRALGATDIIGKPFDPMSLARHVREIWDRHHADATDDDLDGRLAALGREYASGIPARLVALDAAVGALRLGEPVSGALDALTWHAHALAGSAGTFGFAELGECAARLESRADRSPGDPKHPRRPTLGVWKPSSPNCARSPPIPRQNRHSSHP